MPPTLPERNTVLPGIQATSRSVTAPSASSSFHVGNEFADLFAVLFARVYFLWRTSAILFSTGVTRSRECALPYIRVHHRSSSYPVAANFASPPHSHSPPFFVVSCVVSLVLLSVIAVVRQSRPTCVQHGNTSHRAHLVQHERDANANNPGYRGQLQRRARARRQRGDTEPFVRAAHARTRRCTARSSAERGNSR